MTIEVLVGSLLSSRTMILRGNITSANTRPFPSKHQGQGRLSSFRVTGPCPPQPLPSQKMLPCLRMASRRRKELCSPPCIIGSFHSQFQPAQGRTSETDYSYRCRRTKKGWPLQSRTALLFHMKHDKSKQGWRCYL